MNNRGKNMLTALAFTTATMAAIYGINQGVIRRADRKHLMSEDETLTYNWRLGPVIYKKMGKGSPVILLHDLSACSSSYEWSRVSEALAKKHTLYILDLPGCGLSEKQNVTYTNFFFVELITEFIKNVVEEPCDVMATGLSASLAITSCNCDHELFNRLILVNPTSLHTLGKIPGNRSRAAKNMFHIPIIGTLLYHTLISKVRLKKVFTKKLFFDPTRIRQEDIDTYYESGHKKNSSGKYLLSSLIGHYAYFNIIHALQSIDNDIVIVGGSAQTHIHETLEAYQSVNPAIETVMIENTRQLPQLEDPGEFLRQVSVFVNP